jgi:citrate lyase subunit gamma (acyl carrier protein)
VTIAPAEPGSGISLSVESLVLLQYGESIRRTVLSVLQQYGVVDAELKVVDRGALDYALTARTKAALERAGLAGEVAEHA